ncbi:hypothetical protein AQUCO_03300094v1 [Aquilegia coerulea]|uniref:Cytochrome P450 n=1 Tax=Aquilegia coerulea TaxID=218851 RepID=A0A2G5CZF0_AQUCA|nr:hypothetical protein AQUCO_03300094v1 [Aquilegia coerulea]
MGELQKTLLTISMIILISCVWKFFDWIWLKPKKLEKYLRKQGLKGTSYKLFYGDLKERDLSIQEALSKPMEHSHRIGHRVLPFDHLMFQKYGKVAVTWDGPNPIVVVMDPDMIRDILSSDNFLDVGYNPYEKTLVAVAGYNGKKWTKHRKHLTPAFHLDKLEMMLPGFHASCSEMLNKWQKLVSTESCELDVYPELHSLTIDVMSQTIFNCSYAEAKQILEVQRELADRILPTLIFPSIPGLRFLPTKENRRMKYLDRELHTLIRNIVIKKQKAMKNGEAHNNDLLGCLVQSTFKGSEDNEDAENVGISIDDVVQECKFLWLAGKETIGNWLVWTMIVLSMHQDWQQKARDEVLQVFGKSKPDFDRLNKLKVVSMILNEILRLYCPAPGTAKRLTNKKVKLGNAILPPGVYVWPLTVLVHHDHDLWGKDADDFNPNRFSEVFRRPPIVNFHFFPLVRGHGLALDKTLHGLILR